ncbi:uncharacterized protein LOC120081601 [Benincasa hispida]|uniref:uncharacterized protein LOC120081601 n=1 Tax=Benincasa hispida TaxID=102211 RepID=UPI0018FF3CB2|nr:uncharacterized protein LOC120081601 [Benincasa hispida]
MMIVFESGSRSTSEGGSPESESDGDVHRGNANDEVVRVEGGDDLEHSEHEDVEYGKVEGGTYKRSDDMFDDMMGDVREEDELNQVDVFHANFGTERPVDEECPECAVRRREGANADESTYSYLRSIDSALSRLDGCISGLDSRVSIMEENMTEMKGQLSAILSLLQSMHKGSTVNEEMTRSPIPSREPDTTVTASDTPIPIPPLQSDTTPSPTSNPPVQPDTTITTSPIDIKPIQADVPQTEPNMSALHTMPPIEADMSGIPEAATSGIVTTTEGVPLDSRRISRKRKPVDKYTPPAQAKKKNVAKHPLPGVATSIFRSIVIYNVAHAIPHNIMTKMMSWISDDNTNNEVRENSFKPLDKQFFEELITPNSLVECDTINTLFYFMKDKFYTRPDMCMHKFTILPIGVMSPQCSWRGI